MTLRDILTKENYVKYGDLDVYNDVTDDMASCWCGTVPTSYGKEVYESSLNAGAYIVDNDETDRYIVVEVDSCGDDWENVWDDVSAMLSDMAGYGISDEDWSKRFRNEEPPQEESEVEIYRDGKAITLTRGELVRAYYAAEHMFDEAYISGDLIEQYAADIKWKDAKRLIRDPEFRSRVAYQYRKYLEGSYGSDVEWECLKSAIEYVDR